VIHLKRNHFQKASHQPILITGNQKRVRIAIVAVSRQKRNHFNHAANQRRVHLIQKINRKEFPIIIAVAKEPGIKNSLKGRQQVVVSKKPMVTNRMILINQNVQNQATIK
jgi:uncharacterized membrane-anchored protein